MRLGKIHVWWLKQLDNTPNKRMAIGGYSHKSAYYKALVTLWEKGYIEYTAFEIIGLYALTDKGKEYLECHSKRLHKQKPLTRS